MDANRRILLKAGIAGGLSAVAAAAGLLSPAMVMAAWPQAAFEARGMDAAMNTLLGTTAAEENKSISISAPTIAENGAVVNIQVETTIPDAESITVMVDKNAAPLALVVDLVENMAPFIKTRVKIGKTSNVTGIVRAQGKLYRASKLVKVTIGGCGG